MKLHVARLLYSYRNPNHSVKLSGKPTVCGSAYLVQDRWVHSCWPNNTLVYYYTSLELVSVSLCTRLGVLMSIHEWEWIANHISIKATLISAFHWWVNTWHLLQCGVMLVWYSLISSVIQVYKFHFTSCGSLWCYNHVETASCLPQGPTMSLYVRVDQWFQVYACACTVYISFPVCVYMYIPCAWKRFTGSFLCVLYSLRLLSGVQRPERVNIEPCSRATSMCTCRVYTEGEGPPNFC